MSENPDTSLAAAPLTPGFHKATSALATTLGIEPRMMVETLKKQCFPNQNSDNISDAQLASFISVAITLKLNPLVPGMLYAYPGKNGAMVPVTGPDGVFKMLDERIAGGTLDGYECIVFPEDMTQKPTHAMATIWRKGSDHPSKYTALFAEWVVGSNPNWASRPRHMLWIRALKQCARQVIHGIPFDEDEVVIGDLRDVTPEAGKTDRPLPKPRAAKGASAVKENTEVVVTEAEQAAADGAGGTQPMPAAQIAAVTSPAATLGAAAPKPTSKPKAIVQRSSISDAETITITAQVEEFKTLDITKGGVLQASISAKLTAPEFKGEVYHFGGAKLVKTEGTVRVLEALPLWQLDQPCVITLRGELSKKMNKVVAWVESISEEPAVSQQAEDSV